MNSKSSLNQEEIHRYFNYLSGAKRIEFLYGLLHLCQPLELRYLGTCLEEIARKDYEYLYHTEQKTNHLSTPTVTNSNVTEHPNPSTDLSVEDKLDLTDQFTRAHAIVDIGKEEYLSLIEMKEKVSFSSTLGKESSLCHSIISTIEIE